MPIQTGTQAFIDSDGSLVRYQDNFANVTQQNVEQAELVEQRIVECMGEIRTSYMRLAAYLDLFERERLYLARGYDTFKEWLAEINIGSRVAYDLLRIVREAIPVLEHKQETAVVDNLNISQMRALLPILKSEGEDKFVEVAKDVAGRPVRDAYKIIEQAKGKATDNAHVMAFAKKHDYSANTIIVEIVIITEAETFNIGRLVMSDIQMRDFSKVFHAPIEWS